MAQLQPTDKFIVDRGGSTYKTTFQDIEESLDIDVSHEYNAEVIETEGGEIGSFTITDGGTGFIEGISYTGVYNGLELQFTVNQTGVDGVIEEINITSNSAIEGFDETNKPVFVAAPIFENGSINEILSVSNPPTLPDGGSVKYRVRQETTFIVTDDDGNPITDINGDPITETSVNSSGEVEVSYDGVDHHYKVTRRGANYTDDFTNSPAFFEVTDVDGNTSNGSPVEFTIINIGDLDYDDALITIDSVTDGVDTDKAKLTVTVGGLEKNIYLVPGRGIRLNNLEKTDEGEDQIEILNTLTEFSEGGGNVSEGATVIVSEDPPTVDIYNIKDGTLWYNLLNGRLYVAVTYYGATGTKFDWIDASPSSFNDSLRKNQDDSTSFNLRVERNESLNPGGGSFYAYHFNLEELPLIS